MKYLVVLVACLAYASAEIKLEQPEERIISSFIQTTDGYTYLGLNATYLWGAVGVAAVLGVVMLVMASGVLPEAAQKIQRYGQEFSDDIFVDTEQEDVQNRYRRSIADNGKVTLLLSILNTICYFKEFNLLDLIRLDTNTSICVIGIHRGFVI